MTRPARNRALQPARLGGAILSLVLLASALPATAQPASFTYSGAPLAEVIDDVEARSGWRFLYRDALVATARVDLRATEAEIPSALARSLAPQGIAVEADPGRRQILLTAAPPSRRQLDAASAPKPVRRVRGRVVDAETGEALPFATVTWDDGRRGVVCDLDGAFSVELAPGPTVLTASFVGYVAERAAPAGDAVTFRLRSPALTSAPVVIAAPLLDTPLDTAWAGVVQRAGRVGEGGGLRALEALPSVAPGALFSDGTVVRGSAPDAFEVRLDGVPVYNPRHLFGLADAFNLDALRAVALHYGVAPARSAAPPGGTLEYITSAGSLRDVRVQAGVSSLGARASLDGPLRRGRTSALAAGRLSLLGASSWGQDVVALGLGAETRTSPLPPRSADPLDLVLDVTGTSARFWDLHLAAADEGAARRTTATAYLGGDRTALEATRVQRERALDADSPVVERPVETRNRWGSGAFGLDDRRSLGARVGLTSRFGLSRYHARFETDDFTYRTRVNPLEISTDTLGYDNDLVEAIWSEQLDVALVAGTATAGLEAHVYASGYQERSIARAAFERSQTEQRLDLHAAWSGRLGRGLSADLGVRGHLYSASGVRVAPRVRLVASPSPFVTVSAGVGRSHQFVHRITLGDVPAAAAWVLSAPGEPPTEADHAEAALGARVGPASLHVGVYDKRTRDLRLHTETRAVQRFREEGVLGLPWFPDVRSRARGLEALARAPLGPVVLGAVYALSRTDLQHPELGGGEPFRADWDRRHRLTLSGDASPGLGLAIGGAWTWATGTPNALADGADELASHSDLRRLDLRLAVTRPLRAGRVTASVSVRNALDHDNVTVRDRFPLVQSRAASRRLVLRPLDVYDVGRLVTFDLAVGW